MLILKYSKLDLLPSLHCIGSLAGFRMLQKPLQCINEWKFMQGENQKYLVDSVLGLTLLTTKSGLCLPSASAHLTSPFGFLVSFSCYLPDS